MSDETPQRRSGDVDPAVKLFVKDELTETRHALRGDFAELSVKVELWRAESTKEHADVKAALGTLVAANLAARVDALEKKDATDDARTKAINELRKEIRTNRWDWRNWIPAAVSAAVAVYAVASSH